jgi:hypothetical protein
VRVSITASSITRAQILVVHGEFAAPHEIGDALDDIARARRLR